MNILFTSPTSFHPQKGGVGRVTDTLCREFQKRGYTIYYLHRKWYPEDNYPYPASVTILPTNDIYDCKNVEFYHNFLKEKNIDIIINQDGLYESSYLFQNVGNLTISTISVIHSNPIINYTCLWEELYLLKNNTYIEKLKRIIRCLLYPKLKYEVWKSIQQHYQYILEHSTIITLLSAQYELSLKKINPKLLNITYSIPNPNTYEEQKSIPIKQKEIIYVGRLYNSTKRVDRLLKIWQSISKKYPDWHLSIVGDGIDGNMLRQYSQQLRLKQIDFYNFQPPRPFYEKAAIICMTSNFEGFPMVLTEAMQFGCVPVAFNSFEAIADIIIPEKTGELVTPFSIKEYKEKLSLLIENVTYREKLSQAAFQYVKQYDSEIITEQWIQLFQKVRKDLY